jgi:hypothetical protein
MLPRPNHHDEDLPDAAPIASRSGPRTTVLDEILRSAQDDVKRTVDPGPGHPSLPTIRFFANV